MSLDVFDLVVQTAEMENGRSPQFVVAGNKSGRFFGTNVQSKKNMSRQFANWSMSEDDFIRKNIGYMTDQEMADALGRTSISVHLRWKRDLKLPAPSKHPNFITATQAAIMLGVDPYKLAWWCDYGLIPARNMAGNRKMRLIFRVTFMRWVVNPSNWIYFNWKEIPDPHLRRLCELKSARWGEEWITTAEVGRMHGVTSKDVQRLIYRGELPAVQISTSLGGRHKDPHWLYWYVLKSDAVKAKFIKGRGNVSFSSLSPRGEAWALKAIYELGFSWAALNRSMGSKFSDDTVKKLVLALRR